MRIVPVIDLKGGHVVRGVGGRRDEYRPIISTLADRSDPATIARALVAHFAPAEIYVADLDAIVSCMPDVASWRAIAAEGPQLWIDAGVQSSHQTGLARVTLQQAGISGSLVIGLESVPSLDSLAELREAAGNDAIFSLDLRDGVPLTRQATERSLSPRDWARAAVKAGFQRIIVLDLADVGVGRGTSTLDLCRTLSAEFPSMELIAGGGVRELADLRALAAAGCSAALVASALHDGRLTRDDLRAVAQSESA